MKNTNVELEMNCW